MSDPPDGDGEDAGGGAADVDATALATGVIGGIAIPLVQYALWEFTSDGPLTVPGSEGLEAEMALFVAVGVAIPAGGAALLYEDDPLSGVVGAITVVAASFGLRAVLPMPEWFLGGLVGAAVVLAIVAALEWRSPGTGGTPG